MWKELPHKLKKNTDVKYNDKSVKSTIIGITPDFQAIMNYKIQNGYFISDKHYNERLKVCVLGAGVAATF